MTKTRISTADTMAEIFSALKPGGESTKPDYLNSDFIKYCGILLKRNAKPKSEFLTAKKIIRKDRNNKKTKYTSVNRRQINIRQKSILGYRRNLIEIKQFLAFDKTLRFHNDNLTHLKDFEQEIDQTISLLLNVNDILERIAIPQGRPSEDPKIQSYNLIANAFHNAIKNSRFDVKRVDKLANNIGEEAYKRQPEPIRRIAFLIHGTVLTNWGDKYISSKSITASAIQTTPI